MKYLSIPYTIILALFLFLPPVHAGEDRGITPEGLITLYYEGRLGDYTIVDIRDRKKYEELRIPGSLNLPLETLRSTHEVVSSDKKVVIYGETDNEAIKGVGILKERGIKALYLIGGLEGWKKAGGDTEKGPTYTKGLPYGFTIPRGLCEPLEPVKIYGDEE